jgi:hypothetical protein
VANGAGLRDGLLDELEAGATPTDDEAARIKDAIAALGGVPGTEHLRPHEPEQPEQAEQHEPHEQDEAPAESHVNGELVGESAN